MTWSFNSSSEGLPAYIQHMLAASLQPVVHSIPDVSAGGWSRKKNLKFGLIGQIFSGQLSVPCVSQSKLPPPVSFSFTMKVWSIWSFPSSWLSEASVWTLELSDLIAVDLDMLTSSAADRFFLFLIKSHFTTVLMDLFSDLKSQRSDERLLVSA